MQHTLLYDATREEWTRVEARLSLERAALAAQPRLSLTTRIAALGQRLARPAQRRTAAQPARRVASSS